MAEYRGPSMDLANMRDNGVRYLNVTCGCGHRAEVLMDTYDGSLSVPSFNGRFRCSQCKSKKTTVQPAWHLRAKSR